MGTKTQRCGPQEGLRLQRQMPLSAQRGCSGQAWVPRASLGLYLQGSGHLRRPGQLSDGMHGVKSEV